MSSELVVLYCPTCLRDSLAEAPPCVDGHGDECPDRACTECGTALLLDAPLVALVPGVSDPPARSAAAGHGGPRVRRRATA